MGERFNASGVNYRDCPVCLRTGTLTGERTDGAVLECSGGMAPGRSASLDRGGCCTRFVFRPNDATGPTLERLTAELWNHGARLADDHQCSSCGARGYRTTCPTCERAA